ncbi:MAG: hypothetical protein ACW99J_19175 [Candidatus Thorarchaeota archaeon]|jgi:hypothetical protein
MKEIILVCFVVLISFAAGYKSAPSCTDHRDSIQSHVSKPIGDDWYLVEVKQLEED